MKGPDECIVIHYDVRVPLLRSDNVKQNVTRTEGM